MVDVIDSTNEELINVPAGGELVQTGDGRVFWTKLVTGTSPPVYLSYYIGDPADLDTILGEQEFAPRRFDTFDDMRAAGYFDAGFYEEIEGSSNDPAQDPFDTLVVDLEEQMKYSPMFGDPEIMALAAEAVIEGRNFVTDAELRATDYWLTRTEEQRAWDELIAAGIGKNNELPAEALQQLDTNTKLVRAMLVDAGMEDPPDSLVDYLARNFTNGTWNRSQLEIQIEAEVDPYSPNASPFAGKVLDQDQYVVSDADGNLFIRTRNDGDKRLTGPGQEARYGGDARRVITDIPEGRHVVGPDGTHYFEDAEGKLYVATGEGQVAGLARLYGEAVPLDGTVGADHYLRPQGDIPGGVSRGEAAGRSPEPSEAEGDGAPANISVHGTVVDLFGGPGGIEAYGDINETGEAADVLVDANADSNSALGEVERVRQIILDWLGPLHGSWDQRLIEEWAGKVRANPDQEDVLEDMLRNQRMALFPGYDENLRYVDIAAPWEQMFMREWGRMPDQGDDFFNDIINLNNAEQARSVLLREGWQRGNETVRQTVQNGAFGAFGSPNEQRSIL